MVPVPMREHNELDVLGFDAQFFSGLPELSCLLRGSSIDQNDPFILNEIAVIKTQRDLVDSSAHLCSPFPCGVLPSSEWHCFRRYNPHTLTAVSTVPVRPSRYFTCALTRTSDSPPYIASINSR